jgi:hypothetical protein
MSNFKTAPTQIVFLGWAGKNIWLMPMLSKADRTCITMPRRTANLKVIVFGFGLIY